jgi:hypothetical protein
MACDVANVEAAAAVLSAEGMTAAVDAAATGSASDARVRTRVAKASSGGLGLLMSRWHMGHTRFWSREDRRHDISSIHTTHTTRHAK